MYVEEITRVEDGHNWLALFTRQRQDSDLTDAEKQELDQEIEQVKGRIKELEGDA